jgi:hypothetical protein
LSPALPLPTICSPFHFPQHFVTAYCFYSCYFHSPCLLYFVWVLLILYTPFYVLQGYILASTSFPTSHFDLHCSCVFCPARTFYGHFRDTRFHTHSDHSQLFPPLLSIALSRNIRCSSLILLPFIHSSTTIYNPFLEHKMPFIYTTPSVPLSAQSLPISLTVLHHAAYSFTLTEAAGSSEIYQMIWCHNPQNSENHSHQSGNRFKIVIH